MPRKQLQRLSSVNGGKQQVTLQNERFYLQKMSHYFSEEKLSNKYENMYFFLFQNFFFYLSIDKHFTVHTH